MEDFSAEFVRFAAERGALRFGAFQTKAGRSSPYFFNAGAFNDGASLSRLAEFYAKAVEAAGLDFGMLFGPAYKGIPLAVSLALAFAARGRNIPFCFNRKEIKGHGEGGDIVGAPLAGRVLLVDDVISAGTSVRESVALIRAAGAAPCGLVIALDRQERGAGSRSATQEAAELYKIPVVSIATLDHVAAYLERRGAAAPLAAILDYRQRYGATPHE